MEFESDILYPFLEELLERYRQEILEQEEAKALAAKQRELSITVREKLGGFHSEQYKLVSELTGSIYDLSSIQQEQLYIQGVKDGIRLKRFIREIEEGGKG